MKTVYGSLVVSIAACVSLFPTGGCADGVDYDNWTYFAVDKSSWILPFHNPSGGARGVPFQAFDAPAAGGVRVAAGDVNGDGVADVIVGAGPGGGPHVKIFDGSTMLSGSPTLINSFFAFDPAFTGGVFVAAGDVNGDGVDDVIVGAGPGGGGVVKVVVGPGGEEIYADKVFESSFAGGVSVAAGDVNGDGRADVIAAPIPAAGDSRMIQVKVGISNGLPDPPPFLPYTDTFSKGVRVAAGDVDGDGFADIITSPETFDPAVGATVKVFHTNAVPQSQGPANVTFSQVSSFIPFESYSGGVRVAVGDPFGSGPERTIIVTKALRPKKLPAGGSRLGASAQPVRFFRAFGVATSPQIIEVGYGGINPVAPTNNQGIEVSD